MVSLVFVAMLGRPVQKELISEKDPATAINVIFIGDSITEGSNLPQSPPVAAAGFLLKKPGINRLNFSNQGHSGFTTVNFLPSQGDTFKEAELAADSLQKLNEGVLVFSIMLGTNDSAMDGPLGSPVSPEQYRQNLLAICDRLIHDYPRCKIVIHRATWYSPNTYNGSRYLADGLARLQLYFSEIDKVIASYRQTHPRQVFRGDQQAFHFFKKNYRACFVAETGKEGTFFLHPNAEGAKILGRFWADAIYKATRKF